MFFNNRSAYDLWITTSSVSPSFSFSIWEAIYIWMSLTHSSIFIFDVATAVLSIHKYNRLSSAHTWKIVHISSWHMPEVRCTMGIEWDSWNTISYVNFPRRRFIHGYGHCHIRELALKPHWRQSIYTKISLQLMEESAVSTVSNAAHLATEESHYFSLAKKK